MTQLVLNVPGEKVTFKRLAKEMNIDVEVMNEQKKKLTSAQKK